MAKRIRRSGKTYPKVNPHIIIAKSSRVNIMYPLNPSGLEVVFCGPIQQVQRGEDDGIQATFRIKSIKSFILTLSLAQLPSTCLG